MRLLILALSLVALPAMAKQVQWTLSLPTEYEDGQPLPQSDLAEIRLYVDGEPTSYPVQTAGVIDLRSGEYELCATVVTTPESYGEGTESVCSNVITHEVTAPRPNPPTLLEVILAFLHDVVRAFGRLFA